MAKVVRRDCEDLESLLRRWKRKVNDDMILADMKKHEFYRSTSQKKREKREAAELKRAKAERMRKKYVRIDDYSGAYEKKIANRYGGNNASQKKQEN